MRRPLAPGWAEKQTPTPFLYHKLNLKQMFNCRLWGVCRLDFYMSSEYIIEKRKEYLYCVYDLKYALEHVDEKYFKWHMGQRSEKEISENQKKSEVEIEGSSKDSYCERVFAYELYHQFRKLMCDNKKYGTLLFNGEQRKDESFYDDLFKELEDNDYVIPDLILHEELGNKDIHDGQILYIEIKTVNNGNVYSDLKKLSDLTKTSLNFYYYIFIYVDGTIEELKDKVKGIRKKQNYNELDDNILCICVKDYKARCLCLKKIKEMINKENEL